jgi:A/G-specific adenine glycosylase
LILATQKKMFVQRLLEWGEANVRKFPWRDSDSALEILIIEIFLQKTPADRVAARYSDLVQAFTADSTKLDETCLVEQFKDLGLEKRVRWLIRLRKVIDEQYGGRIPSQIMELRKLPGVGLYTANAVRCFAFQERVPLVDVNAIRILSRVFNVELVRYPSAKSPIYELAASLVPEDRPKLYNLSILDLGALVCKIRPDCSRCPMQSFCSYNVSMSCS